MQHYVNSWLTWGVNVSVNRCLCWTSKTSRVPGSLYHVSFWYLGPALIQKRWWVMEWINEWMNWWLLNRQKCNLVCWTFFWRIPNRISLFILPLFLWQDDEVVLQSVATFQKEHHKFCLAAEGLGNRICYLESTSEAKVRRKKKHIISNFNR